MRAAFAFPFFLALLFACGARTPLELGGGVVGDDGGAPPSGDGAPPDSASNEPTYVGYVGAIGTGTEGAFALARFYPTVVDPACAYLGAVGTCTVVDCFSSAATPPSDDGGDVNATAGSSETLLLYQGASPSGTYPTATFTSSIDPGTSVDFVGRGAVDVPPFMVSVTMPPFGTLTSPVFQISETINTSLDLPLEWEPVQAGDAVFALSPPTSSAASPTLVCFFDGASGAGVVPRAQLQAIKQASPGGEAQASFLAMSRASTTAGQWTVNAIAVTGTGLSQQSGAVMLQ